MDTIEILTPNETQPRALTPEEAAMTDNVMRHCLAVEPNERVVVLARSRRAEQLVALTGERGQTPAGAE